MSMSIPLCLSRCIFLCVSLSFSLYLSLSSSPFSPLRHYSYALSLTNFSPPPHFLLPTSPHLSTLFPPPRLLSSSPSSFHSSSLHLSSSSPPLSRRSDYLQVNVLHGPRHEQSGRRVQEYRRGPPFLLKDFKG